MKFVKLIAELLGAFVLVATFLTYIRTDEWWIRVFDFPRVQLLFIGLLVVVVFWFLPQKIGLFDKVLIALLGVALLVQCWHIIPYTPLARKQVKGAEDQTATIRVFVANVLQENRRSPELIDGIAKVNPDIILLNEMDDWWTEQLRPLEKSHPETVLHPRTNTYGMNLYSRFDLIDPEVRFLLDPEIPSIRTKIQMPGGRMIHFYGVHPQPPALKKPEQENRQDSEQRDAELVMIAKEVAKLKGPVIVAGDFNDVAWSHTTRLFQRTSRLLDPRVGRGLYNSYSAKIPMLRYPLDHLFHSDEFTFVTMERMSYFGSDHFPIFVALNIEPEAAQEQEAPPRKAGDKKEAEKILTRPAEKE
ncbi:MAG: endonuclease/exonuclease/phosphatase family protein [Verrucomicrobia bacterium]|nr:endonuclease/exonuclease/phosphatase family protein [Verrucomicrobiota bacterium]